MSDRIASWWVVKRATEWDGISTVRHFLVPYSIPVPEEEDPVEDVLWETADAAIPAGLSFPNQQKDSMSHTAVFGDEGIEIDTPSNDRIPLGALVELSLTVVANSVKRYNRG